MKRADDLAHERASLKEKLCEVHRDLQILVEWQIANLVLHGVLIMRVSQTALLKPEIPNASAFAEFAWDYVLIPDKVELKKYDMSSCQWNLQDPLPLITNYLCVIVLHLYYRRFSNFPPKKSAALQIYSKLPETPHAYTDCVMISKWSASTKRKRLVHPEISQEYLEFFLRDLGDSTPN